MSTPTINVNLKPCTCRQHGEGVTRHFDDCPHAPVLIPCPIQRSVTFEARIGECACGYSILPVKSFSVHADDCPARPVKVSCSISGETWAESEAEHCGPHRTLPTGTTYEGTWATGEEENRALAACRERWALVKALVLDMTAGPDVVRADLRSLVQQRDAVFSALANMARAEQAEFREWLSLPDEVKRKCQTDPPDIEHERTPAVESLAAYVEHLIEQVGVLP